MQAKAFFSFAFRYRLIVIVGLTVFALGLFINRPANIDDVPFLAISRQIAADPLHPYSFLFSWDKVAKPAYEMADPPLVMYYLGTAMRLFGDEEALLHGVFLIFPILALVSFYSIAREYSPKPLVAVIFMIIAPVFFVSATSLMMDVPFLAVSLAAIALFQRSLKTSVWPWALFAGLVAGAATLVKYTAVVPVAIISLGYLLNKKFASLVLFLLSSLLVVVIWNSYFFAVYGVIHAAYVRSLSTAVGVLNFSAASNLFLNPTWLTFFGGSITLATPLLFFALKRSFALSALVLAAVHLMVMVMGKKIGIPTTTNNALLFFILLGNGSLLFWSLCLYLLQQILVSGNKKSSVFLFIWFGGALTIPLLLSPFFAVRYLTFILPPFAILAANSLASFEKRRHSLLVILPWLYLLGTFWLSLMIATGDYLWAEKIKAIVETNWQSQTTGTVWYVGHWGLQYYAQKQGKSFFDLATSKPKKGDIFLIPTNIPPQLYPDFSRLRQISQKDFYYDWPVKTMYWPGGAGWYSQYWGNLPLTVDQNPVETITVYVYQGSEAQGTE